MLMIDTTKARLFAAVAIFWDAFAQIFIQVTLYLAFSIDLLRRGVCVSVRGVVRFFVFILSRDVFCDKTSIFMFFLCVP